MRLIEPNSQELRDLKAKAIIDYDISLMEQLKKVEGKEFILVDSFLDLLMATSINEDQTIVRTSKFKESFLKPWNEKNT